MRHTDAADDTGRPPLRYCPSCRGPVSRRLHIVQIAGDVIVDCPTCWTTTVLDQAGRVIRRRSS
jgi:hypothetical protein